LTFPAGAKLGRHDEAAAEFARAASMTRNLSERNLLLDRARAEGEAAEPAGLGA
jgi:predicted RNA polymerase sigma factor